MPGTPSSIADVNNTKVVLERTKLHIPAELTPIFPNLLANGADGMQQLSIKVDNENGSILKSDKALRVSILLRFPDLALRLAASSPEARLPADTT